MTEPLVSENLVSQFHLALKKNVLEQAQEFVEAVSSLREHPDYVHLFSEETSRLNIEDPGNRSILMSYDFHLNPEGTLELIEINTNASFLALSNCLYEFQGHTNPVADFQISEIKKDILQELELFGKASSKPRIAIIDDHPEQQKLYIEFLIYQELFKSWGFPTEILDFRKITDKFDFVYNRHTDFYFSDPDSASCLDFFKKKTMCFSPQPFEYLLLADKERLIQWNENGFLEKFIDDEKTLKIFRRHLPWSKTLTAENSEEVWSQRKTAFLKPKRAFGGKQTYRGSSISRKAFEPLINQDFVVQKFVPAPELQFETPEGPKDFKYDLRFYAYRGRIQSAIARLYQGQVTNLKTPYGGFTSVSFS